MVDAVLLACSLLLDEQPIQEQPLPWQWVLVLKIACPTTLWAEVDLLQRYLMGQLPDLSQGAAAVPWVVAVTAAAIAGLAATAAVTAAAAGLFPAALVAPPLSAAGLPAVVDQMLQGC